MKITIQPMIYLFVFCSLICITTATIAQTYYKWIDKNGSTHYTKTSPPQNSKNLGKVETFGSDMTTKASQPSTTTEVQRTETENEATSTTNQNSNPNTQSSKETSTPIGTAQNNQK